MGSKTTNYEFSLPDDNDYTDQMPYNSNFSSIDTILKNQEDAVNCITPQVSGELIDSVAIAEFLSGTKSGAFDVDVLGTAVIGVLRAYAVSATDAMQIIETTGGDRYTRHYTSGAWSAWI
jgi:hypothetical protein